jgi:hypothetical protein
MPCFNTKYFSSENQMSAILGLANEDPGFPIGVAVVPLVLFFEDLLDFLAETFIVAEKVVGT